MAASKSEQAKAAWAKARRYAKANGISVSEARSRLARQTSAPSPTKQPKPRNKKRVTPPLAKNKELQMAEQELRAKYPHIVEGSLRIETDGAHQGRRSVEIACQATDAKNGGASILPTPSKRSYARSARRFIESGAV